MCISGQKAFATYSSFDGLCLLFGQKQRRRQRTKNDKNKCQLLKIRGVVLNNCRFLVHGKNDFAKVSNNLARYRSDNKIILLNLQNNYTGNLSMMNNIEKSFDIQFELNYAVIILIV